MIGKIKTLNEKKGFFSSSIYGNILAILPYFITFAMEEMKVIM